MTPRMPPLVVTRSPFFNSLSICCHFFCFFWFGAIIRKYINATKTTSISGCAKLPSAPIQFHPSYLHLLFFELSHVNHRRSAPRSHIRPGVLFGNAAGGER